MTPLQLGQSLYRNWQSPKHIQRYSKWIAALALRDDVNRLAVAAPVRHGKSQLFSVVLPVWWLLRYPQQSVFIVTHSAAFSNELSAKVRDFINELAPETGIRVDPRYRAKDHWKTTAGGTFHARGLGGTFSGLGAHLIVADDLVKDAQAAASPVQRAHLNEYMRSELLTRLEPDGKCVVVLARRHPDDVVGWLLAQNGELQPRDRWHYIHDSALTYAPDGTPQALWPERFSVEKLEAIKRESELSNQAYIWACLYQNEPYGDPALFDWPDSFFTDVLYDEQPHETRMRLLAIDPSKGKQSKAGDYSAVVCADVTPDGHFYIIDSSLKRMNIDMLEDTVVAYAQRYQPHAILCEANANQDLIAQNIVKKAQNKGISCPMHTWVNTENKVVRIRMSLTPLLAQGKLHIRNTPDSVLGLSQLRAFPTAPNDDYADALDLAVRLHSKLTRGIPTPQPRVIKV